MGVVKLLQQSEEDKENKYNYSKRKRCYLKNCPILKLLPGDDAAKREKEIKYGLWITE